MQPLSRYLLQHFTLLSRNPEAVSGNSLYKDVRMILVIGVTLRGGDSVTSVRLLSGTEDRTVVMVWFQRTVSAVTRCVYSEVLGVGMQAVSCVEQNSFRANMSHCFPLFLRRHAC
jgi:hypothetical protein